MTAAADRRTTEALAAAVQRAVRAPSVHNTQPWRFVAHSDGLELFADRGRQLHALDPSGRELLLSCGAALFTVRVALAAAGHAVAVQRFPDPAQPDLLARLQLVAGEPADPSLAELAPAIEARQTNRRRFSDETVPADVITALVASARRSGGTLLAINRPEDRLAVGALVRLADRRQLLDPAYRAELRAWTSDDAERRDGVSARTVPQVGANSPAEVPIRDFDTRGSGYLPADTGSNADQCLLVLGTYTDDPPSWLDAGAALQRVLLEVARRGYAAGPLTQIVEDPDTREQLRALLPLSMYPHVLLRVGHAPPAPGSRRRPIGEVLTED